MHLIAGKYKKNISIIYKLNVSFTPKLLRTYTISYNHLKRSPVIWVRRLTLVYRTIFLQS